MDFVWVEANRSISLLVAIRGRAPFPKCGNGFGVVVRLQKHDLLAILHHQRGIKAWGIHEYIERLLRQAQSHRRDVEHVRGEFDAFCELRVAWHDIADKTDGLGAVGFQETACH